MSEPIASVDEVPPGHSKKFLVRTGGEEVEAFVVNVGGAFHAYVNRCRHMPTPLDFVRDEFLSDDGRFLRCYTHGALYEFASGRCIEGPCKGESLYRLPVRVDNDEVLVGCPSGDLRELAD